MVSPYTGRITIDLGTGDGRFVYHGARRDSERLFIGIDPVADAMAEYSRRAIRRPQRGGAANALFVVSSLETLPEELAGLADRLTINFPWGSLLRAVALPEADALACIARLCRPRATLEIVLSFDPERDLRAAELGLTPLSENQQAIRCGYAEAGFNVPRIERLEASPVRGLPSTWAKRLAFGRERQFWRITARRCRE